MTYLITGATGFIGSAYTQKLLSQNIPVIALVRNKDRARNILGNQVRLITHLDEVANHENIQSILNLAGAPIAASPWTKSRREELVASRLETTEGLISLIERLDNKPSLMISASAVGYYGRGGDIWLTEDSPPQDIFMSTLCQGWEAAASRAADFGVRLVIPRISVVLGRAGGALPQLALPIKMGLGARFGRGGHYFPWIHLSDLLSFFDYAADHPSVSGAYNIVTHDTHTQDSFNKLLAKKLGRPYFMVVPKFLLKTLLREMSDLFIEGQRLKADKLYNTGFQPKFETLSTALDDLYNR